MDRLAPVSLLDRVEPTLVQLLPAPADIEAARAALRRGDASATLVAALALAGSGEREHAARLALDSAASGAPMQIRVVAVWLLLALGQAGLAIKPVRRALAVKPVAPEILEQWVDLCQDLGWYREALEAMQALAASQAPRRLPLLVRGAQLLLARRNPSAAVEWFARASALARDDAALLLGTADALERGDQPTRALGVLRPLLRSTAALSSAQRLEAAQLLVRVGAFDDAERVLRALVEDEPDNADARLALGEQALWRGDHDAAASAAAAALAIDSAHAGGHRLQAALAMIAGRREEALRLLDEVLRRLPEDSAALAWRAEARLLNGDAAAAVDDAERAIGAADGFSLVGWMLYVWAAIDSGRIGAAVLRQNYEEIIRGVGVVVPGGDAVLVDGDPSRIVALLRDALQRLNGNRMTVLTTVDANGRLRRLDVPPGPRFLSRRALNLLETSDPDVVLAALDAAAAAHPTSGLPDAHRGEVLLWLGRTDAARAAFDAALEKNPFTRWAYIGMAGVSLLEDDAAAALEWCDRGNRQMQSAGPSVFGYRGEALSHLGRREEAVADLRAAVASHPSRVGAWVNLALALGGDAADERRAIWQRLCSQAPGLLHDAGAECGIEAPALDTPADATVVAVLERARRMLRGNRSSNLVTYFTRAGRMRCVPRPRRSHGVDPAQLRDALRLVIAAASD